MIEQEFTRDICLHPEDDELRLIFADWLSDNGQEERSEFIRVQLELEELKKEKGKSTGATLAGFPVRVMPLGHMERQLELERREQELLTNGKLTFNFLKWLKVGTGWNCFWNGEPKVEFGWILPGPLGGINPKCFVKFRRGFVEEIILPCLAFREHAREIFSHHPVRKVILGDREPNEWYPDADFGDSGSMQGYFWDLEWDETSPNEQVRELSRRINQHNPRLIPSTLFDLFVGGISENYHSPTLRAAGKINRRIYRFKVDALEDLSQACVKWGRRQAGLGEER